MQFHDGAGDGQSKAEAAEKMVPGDRPLLERLKNLFQQFGIDANAGIGHFEPPPRLLPSLKLRRDKTARQERNEVEDEGEAKAKGGNEGGEGEPIFRSF